MQESLGGNSRTTLIINCSPSPYNETETLSTLRFGMRAKSIKNKARVNAELSPAELKALLKKAQRDYSNAGAYIGLLEQEVNVWREGGKVEKEQWASMEKALGLGEGELEKLVGGPAKSPTPGSAPGRTTPRPPALDRISEGDVSRPDTPMSGSLGADEREDLLRRQNEMEDQLAKTARLPKTFSTLSTDARRARRSRNCPRRRSSSEIFAKSCRRSRSPNPSLCLNRKP